MHLATIELNRRSCRLWLAGVLVLAGLCAPCSDARTPGEREIINIWPGPAPGTEHWNITEYVGENSVTNVTLPTLTVFRPEPGRVNGTAVIVVPGGEFQGLAIKLESTSTAQWLAARGITAFALKYRVKYTPGFELPAGDRFDESEHTLATGRRIAVADALQAMRYLRANAEDYDIDPDRIGMIGFSAGAMTTMGVIMAGKPDARPDFAAAIYGSMIGDTPPQDGPPLFIVHAQDDPSVPVAKSVEIYSNWTAAGLPVELHIFETGGHGFGAIEGGQPTDLWLDAFDAWLRQHGWIASDR